MVRMAIPAFVTEVGSVRANTAVMVITIAISVMMIPVAIMMPPVVVMPMMPVVMPVVAMMSTVVATVMATVGLRGDSGRCDTGGEREGNGGGCARELFENGHLMILCFISRIRSRC